MKENLIDAIIIRNILFAPKGTAVMIKIFQFADLHLDSPFVSDDIRKSEAGRASLRDALSRIALTVRQGGYGLVLIPGDFYENGFLTEETATLILKELASVGCPVVIAPGNHDPFSKGSFYATADFPENVHVFSSGELSFFDIDPIGVRVYGYAFTEQTMRSCPITGTKLEMDGRIGILCAHADVTSPLSPYAPLSYADVEDSGITYAGFGHIHNAPSVFRSVFTTCAYSGFVEGRAFDELGFGTALQITIDETEKIPYTEVKKITVGKRRFAIEKLNVTGACGNSDICSSLIKMAEDKGYGEETSLRVILEGFLGADFMPCKKEIRDTCGDRFAYLEVRDCAIPFINGDALEKDITLRGEFYRTLKEKMQSGDSDERRRAVLAFRMGLAALEGRDLSVFMPD